MDKRDLKIQALREALRERVSSITDEYENRIVDLRIELTELAEAHGALTAEVTQLRQEKDAREKAEAEAGTAENPDDSN